MKVTVTYPTPAPKPPAFPRLMRLRDNPEMVVLFMGPRSGTVIVAGGSRHKVGDFSDVWIDAGAPVWENFEGTVELSNG